jgi:hypothetical protein
MTVNSEQHSLQSMVIFFLIVPKIIRKQLITAHMSLPTIHWSLLTSLRIPCSIHDKDFQNQKLNHYYIYNLGIIFWRYYSCNFINYLLYLKTIIPFNLEITIRNYL